MCSIDLAYEVFLGVLSNFTESVAGCDISTDTKMETVL